MLFDVEVCLLSVGNGDKLTAPGSIGERDWSLSYYHHREGRTGSEYMSAGGINPHCPILVS